jgi:hypothetical protein
VSGVPPTEQEEVADVSDSDYERLMLERRCVHCDAEAQGGFYTGRTYLHALQKHRGEEAVRLARKVEPFFWGDADIIRVRLCGACAAELGLEEPPHVESADDSLPTSEPERGRARGARRGRGPFGREHRDGSRKMRVCIFHLPLVIALAASHAGAQSLPCVPCDAGRQTNTSTP